MFPVTFDTAYADYSVVPATAVVHVGWSAKVDTPHLVSGHNTFETAVLPKLYTPGATESTVVTGGTNDGVGSIDISDWASDACPVQFIAVRPAVHPAVRAAHPIPGIIVLARIGGHAAHQSVWKSV